MGFVGTQLAIDGGLTVLQIVTIRFLIAAVIMGVVFYKKIKKSMNKRALISGIILGIAQFTAFSLQTAGQMLTTPSKNAFITSSSVIIVPIIGLLLFKKKLDKLGIISSFMALIGIGILSLESDFTLNLGDILTFMCAIGFACHIVFTGEFVKVSNAIVLTVVQFATAFVLSFIAQICTGQLVITTTSMGVVGVLYLGVFSTCICFFLQTVCQKRVEGNRAAVILSMEAVFGTIFSVLLLGESITSRLLIGSSLIFIAIIIAETKLSFLKFGRRSDSKCSVDIDCDSNPEMS
jgi:drug/metabolite transporter (DMT)-like permease